MAQIYALFHNKMQNYTYKKQLLMLFKAIP